MGSCSFMTLVNEHFTALFEAISRDAGVAGNGRSFIEYGFPGTGDCMALPTPLAVDVATYGNLRSGWSCRYLDAGRLDWPPVISRRSDHLEYST
ncbi:hypothetical protein Bhyg_12915 [Pseudolycoriella hygida]|uniref:Uncharacterized protein n=1 Tax=Pseudolycoriella hygida TaxID=35572 RepID=A0A9Q0MY59_9DIPT|nr:hypothetical protein Bhyg_12915 [Pseudolycoriella hygida]